MADFNFLPYRNFPCLLVSREVNNLGGCDLARLLCLILYKFFYNWLHGLSGAQNRQTCHYNQQLDHLFLVCSYNLL